MPGRSRILAGLLYLSSTTQPLSDLVLDRRFCVFCNIFCNYLYVNFDRHWSTLVIIVNVVEVSWSLVFLALQKPHLFWFGLVRLGCDSEHSGAAVPFHVDQESNACNGAVNFRCCMFMLSVCVHVHRSRIFVIWSVALLLSPCANHRQWRLISGTWDCSYHWKRDNFSWDFESKSFALLLSPCLRINNGSVWVCDIWDFRLHLPSKAGLFPKWFCILYLRLFFRKDVFTSILVRIRESTSMPCHQT